MNTESTAASSPSRATSEREPGNGTVEIVLALIAVAIAAGLRQWQLAEWTSSESEAQLLTAMRRGDSLPWWLAPLNALGFPSTLLIRFLPFATGLCSLPVLMAVARAAFGTRTALAFGFLLALSPGHLALSTHGSPATIWFLLASLGAVMASSPKSRMVQTLLGVLALIGAAFLAKDVPRAPLFLLAGPIETAVHSLGLGTLILALLGTFADARSHPGRIGLLWLAGVGSVFFEEGGSASFEVTHGIWILLAARGLAAIAPRPLLLQAALIVLAVAPSIPTLLSQLRDNARYPLQEITRELQEQRLAGEPVWSTHPNWVTSLTTLPCQPLPSTGNQLQAGLPSNSRGYVVVLLERGRLIPRENLALQTSIQSSLKLAKRVARRRFDRFRLEARLYVHEPTED